MWETRFLEWGKERAGRIGKRKIDILHRVVLYKIKPVMTMTRKTINHAAFFSSSSSSSPPLFSFPVLCVGQGMCVTMTLLEIYHAVFLSLLVFHVYNYTGIRTRVFYTLGGDFWLGDGFFPSDFVKVVLLFHHARFSWILLFHVDNHCRGDIPSP